MVFIQKEEPWHKRKNILQNHVKYFKPGEWGSSPLKTVYWLKHTIGCLKTTVHSILMHFYTTWYYFYPETIQILKLTFKN
jgi:hypothetical protein